MGISLADLDGITLGFILDLVEENNSEVKSDEEIEVTPEILARF